MKKITLALSGFILAGFSSAFSQCMMVEIPLAGRTQASPVIFEGKVLDKVSFWNEQHTNIYTSNTVEVYKVFKGDLTAATAEIVTPGGTVGAQMEMVHPSLELNSGDVGVFFADASQVLNSPASVAANNRYETYAGPQGFIRYNLTEQTAADPFKQYLSIEQDIYAAIGNVTGQSFVTVQPFNVHAYRVIHPVGAMAPSISGFTPTTITAGTLSTLTINGSGFGATQGSSTVGLKNADDGGNTYNVVPAKNIVSWSDAQIKILVPSKCGTGTVRVTNGTAATSTSTLTITYGEITATDNQGVENKLNLVNEDSNGGYTFKYCTTFNNNTAAVGAFSRALQTWRCGTLVNFNASGTTADVCYAQDGTCIVNFDGGCTLASGLLGITHSYFSGCSSGGTWYWTLVEMDINFETNAYPWNFGPGASSGGKYDFESTALHELGHAHLLCHVINPPALMHWNRAANTDVRTLDPNVDVAAGNDIISRSTTSNPCGASAHVKLTSGTCGFTGVNEPAPASSLVSVYPMPASSSVTFDLEGVNGGAGEVTLGIYDITGRQQFKSEKITSSQLTLDAGTLSSGVYLYRVYTNGAITGSGKLVITKE